MKRAVVDGWDTDKALEEATALGLTNETLKQFSSRRFSSARGNRAAHHPYDAPSPLRLALVLSSAIAIVAHPSASDQPPAPNQPGTGWTEAQLRQSIELARVGRKLTPRRWPNNARVAVCTQLRHRQRIVSAADGKTSPTTLSAADFGAETGCRESSRCSIAIRFLRRSSYRGRRDAASRNDTDDPESGRHEIGVHGWIHEFATARPRPKRKTTAGPGDRLPDECDREATGRLSRASVGVQRTTIDLIRKAGFLYDSSLRRWTNRTRSCRTAKHRYGRAGDRLDADGDAILGRGGTMPSPEVLFSCTATSSTAPTTRGRRSC